MEKIKKVEQAIKQSKDVDEMVERLFWMDCYLIDEGQYIFDANQDKIYGHSSHYFTTMLDLMGDDYFSLYHETDEELISDLEKF